MDAEHRCPHCGNPLSPEDPSGLCGRCLIEQGLLELRAPLREPESADADLGFLDPLHGQATPECPGRYAQHREIARGGMARILLAHDGHLGRDIAIKELQPEAQDDAASPWPVGPLRERTHRTVRFVREARITGQLEHPYIVPVHELGCREDGTLYYTMKYVRGISLAEAIGQAPSPADRRKLLQHVLNVCQAIAYAHSRGVLHRDIKPANIMVGEFGETVVLDWGLARVQQESPEGPPASADGCVDPGEDSDSGTTSAGQVLGTPTCMAPEQAQGNVAAVDERTDVYGLGALLYVVLTGRPPFDGKARQELIQQVLHAQPAPVRDLVADTPPELAAICAKAMARDPDRRYQTARELADELQRFLTGGLIAAHRYRFTDHLRRFARRNRKLLVLAAMAVATIVALSAGSYLRILGERNRALAAESTAEQNLRLAQDAVDKLITEVSDNDLMNLPHMEPVRRRLLEYAVAYCRQLVEQSPEDDEASMSVAAEAQGRLGNLYRLLGRNEEALTAQEKAHGAYSALAAAYPGKPEYRLAVANTLLMAGEVNAFLERYEDALAAYAQAELGLAGLARTDPDATAHRELLAKTAFCRGEVLVWLGRHSEALDSLESARQDFAALAAAHPESAALQRDLALVWQQLSAAYDEMRKPRESAAAAEAARGIFVRLVEAYPDALRYQQDLAQACIAVGSEESLRHAVDALTALAAAHP